MPFPVEAKYIEATEEKLKAIFPESFKDAMMKDNGGTVFVEYEDDDEAEDWELYPFLDKTDYKRESRTCNDIVLETGEARKWSGFPQDAVAIASNGCGDQMIFLKEDGSDNLENTIYSWDHETREIYEVCDDFSELKKE
ncbi:MAG: SMI1/KNR4 family protein [Proteobacteria bacterium]|nr:SMI1/KNR4 family protein [Pseudomonadota bacterium]